MTHIYTHKHHIIPRHMGGSDDPSNLVELTIEEHAEAHRLLWEEHGKKQDWLAWKGLLGQIGKEDILLEFASNRKNSTWYYNPQNPEERRMLLPEDDIPSGWVAGRGTNTWASNRDYTNVSDEHRAKTSASGKKAWASGAYDNRPQLSKEARKKIGEKNRGKKREKVTCPHCQKSVAVNVAPRWHFDNCKHKA